MSHFHSKRFLDLEYFSNQNESESSSEKKHQLYEENPILVKREELESSGIRILDLTESNPTKVGLIFPPQLIQSEIAHHWTGEYDPHPQGSILARLAVKKYYNERFPDLKNFFHEDDFFLLSSTSEGYSYILKAITNPGDEILVPSPSYPLLDYLAKFEMVDTIPYESWDEIPQLITEKTKAILIVQPNNPTGKILSSSESLELARIASRFHLAVVVDEVFADYTGWANSSIYQFFQSKDILVFTLNGISKICLLPSAKLSWIHMQAPQHLRKKILSRMEWLADTYLSVNQFSQLVLPLALDSRHIIQNQLINRLKRNLGKLTEVLDSQVFTWSLPDGGWYLIVEISKISINEDVFCQRLLTEHHATVHTGSMFGMESESMNVVLSLILPEEDFINGLNSILSVVNAQ
jgi:alanine-synthesizing transaminase